MSKTKATKGKIAVQAENIFPIIKKFLYSEHEIFLRELVSNAVDATSKLKTLAMKGTFDEELGDLTIDIVLDKENKTLTISDKGIGMTEEEVEKYLNQVAFSSAEEFIEKYKDDANIIGHFGLGFYSAFMVSDEVEVLTKSYQKGAPAVKWTCDGNPEYTIEPIEKDARGTDVVLHISEDSVEFLEKDRIEGLLKKYCRYLPVPIRFGTKTVTEEVEKDGKKETVSEEVDNIINNPNPLWKRNPKDLTDEDYIQFYEEMYPFTEKPLFWIHLNIDYPFNLTGILYFPKLSNAMEYRKNKIHLYSNQVFVTDEVGQIVPEYLTLLHGVIDSPDIPLNVSRSYLQSDSNVRKISSYISRKVIEKLKEIFKNDREKFESKWDEIGIFIKYGMLSDDKFYEKALDFVLFKNVEEKFFTLEEYKEKIKANQLDKEEKYVFIYTNNPENHNPLIQAAQSKGYDVLWLGDVIDPHFIQMLEQKLSDVRFIRIDAESVEHLINKDENLESVLSDKEQEKVKALFEKINDQKGIIELKPLSPDAAPVSIVKPEFFRRMQDMQQLQGGMPGGMGGMDFFNVVINTNHPLIAQKLLKMRKEEKKEDFAKYLVDLAMLSQNMLKGERMTQFVNRSIEFMKG